MFGFVPSHVTEKKPFLKVDGEWNGVMYAHHQNGVSHTHTHHTPPHPHSYTHTHTPHTHTHPPTQDKEVFVDTLTTPTIRKKIKKLHKMEKAESRLIWQGVTEALGRKDVETATEAKHTVRGRGACAVCSGRSVRGRGTCVVCSWRSVRGRGYLCCV